MLRVCKVIKRKNLNEFFKDYVVFKTNGVICFLLFFPQHLKYLSLIERTNESPKKKENKISSVELELKGFLHIFNLNLMIIIIVLHLATSNLNI